MKESNHVYEAELRKDKYQSLYNDLKKYEDKGIRVCVRGNYFPLTKCVEIMTVNENECYMPDIVEDAYGRIVEVNYDIVAHV